jgi:alpha-pyrone synthase
MSAFISKIGIALPPYKTEQSQLAEYMTEVLPVNQEEAHQLKVIYRASGIKTRYSVLPDFQQNSRNRFNKSDEFPSIKDRMTLYKEQALPLAQQALSQLFEAVDKENLTHLIVVSCTGMYAPGLDIELIQTCGLSTSIERTSIQYMGCYAAFNGLKTARSIVESNADAVVAMVCVELCSIHLQKDTDEDALLSNALFGDGAASALITSKKVTDTALSLEQQFNDLYFDGKNEMSWNIGNHGFEMKLSGKVPDVIRTGISSLTDKLLSQLDVTLRDISHFAIHPGGKKILDVIRKELGLEKEDLEHSLQVLKDYGNMSSGTVLFVLHKLWSKLTTQDDETYVLSFAFGPGLTMESLLLKVHAD